VLDDIVLFVFKAAALWDLSAFALSSYCFPLATNDVTWWKRYVLQKLVVIEFGNKFFGFYENIQQFV
jgi:hypothetical protein